MCTLKSYHPRIYNMFHPRVLTQGPNLGSHPKYQPQGSTPWSHFRIPPHGPTPGFQVLGPTLGSQSHFSGMQLRCNFIETTLWQGCSPASLLHIFRKHFPKNTSGGLLLMSLCIFTPLTFYMFNERFAIFPVQSLVHKRSQWKYSIIKGVLRNFAKFREKHLCQSLFFNKVAGLRL